MPQRKSSTKRTTKGQGKQGQTNENLAALTALVTRIENVQNRTTQTLQTATPIENGIPMQAVNPTPPTPEYDSASAHDRLNLHYQTLSDARDRQAVILAKIKLHAPTSRKFADLQADLASITHELIYARQSFITICESA